MRPQDLEPLDDERGVPVYTPMYFKGRDYMPLLGVKGCLVGAAFGLVVWGLIALLWWWL